MYLYSLSQVITQNTCLVLQTHTVVTQASSILSCIWILEWCGQSPMCRKISISDSIGISQMDPQNQENASAFEHDQNWNISIKNNCQGIVYTLLCFIALFVSGDLTFHIIHLDFPLENSFSWCAGVNSINSYPYSQNHSFIKQLEANRPAMSKISCHFLIWFFFFVFLFLNKSKFSKPTCLVSLSNRLCLLQHIKRENFSIVRQTD